MGAVKQAMLEREYEDRLQFLHDTREEEGIYITEWERGFLDNIQGKSYSELSPAQQEKAYEMYEEFQSRLSMHHAMTKDD